MKYKVYYKSIDYVYLEVEANSPEEARAIAEDTDGGEFINDGYGSWEYDYITDENENLIEE